MRFGKPSLSRSKLICLKGTFPGFSTVKVTLSESRPSVGDAWTTNAPAPLLLIVIDCDVDCPSWVVTTAVTEFAPGVSGTSFAWKNPKSSMCVTAPFTVTAELAGADTKPRTRTLSSSIVALASLLSILRTGAPTIVMFTAGDVAVPPTLSVALAVSEYVPPATLSHTIPYGAVVDVL